MITTARSEQRLKEWVFERALERRVSIGTIRRMIASGKLKPEITRRLNARVVFVRRASVNNL